MNEIRSERDRVDADADADPEAHETRRFERQRAASNPRLFTDPDSGLTRVRGELDPETGLVLSTYTVTTHLLAAVTERLGSPFRDLII